jgi:geranylgeranyl reductase family protein
LAERRCGVKIVIVGAGPIGCYTARLLKRHGVEPLLIEEHKEIGSPVHCAGVVGREVFQNSVLPLPNDSIKNRLDGAQIFYGQQSFTLNRESVAYVIDREVFDKGLGEGLDVMYETRFLGFEKAQAGYVVETDKGDFEADIIIGADGATSRVREVAGLNEGLRYFRGVQFKISTRLERVNFVKVYIKKPFFAWIVPESDRLARVGIISENPYNDLNKFLEEVNIGGEIVDKFGGIIPVGFCQTVKDNVALVGDAACQAKPLTHGGIFYGMRGAEILADCIIKGRLLEYDRLWKKMYGSELRMGLYFKTMYEKLDEKSLDMIFQIMRLSSKKIEQMADFENHSSIIIEIIKDKQVQERLGSVLWNIIKSHLSLEGIVNLERKGENV